LSKIQVSQKKGWWGNLKHKCRFCNGADEKERGEPGGRRACRMQMRREETRGASVSASVRVRVRVRVSEVYRTTSVVVYGRITAWLKVGG